MQSLAFPMRVQENGLLRRDERASAVIALLQMMARTPRGSWAACPNFGLRDLFESNRQRADTPRLMGERIEATLSDLAITGYHVAEVTRELSPGRDTETYAIVLENEGGTESVTTSMSSYD